MGVNSDAKVAKGWVNTVVLTVPGQGLGKGLAQRVVFLGGGEKDSLYRPG